MRSKGSNRLFEGMILIRLALEDIVKDEGCSLLRSSREKESVDVSKNSLLVYFYLLRKRRSCGVREVQRALGFSSSSSAHYHLEKLLGQGILTKDAYGNYSVNQNAKVAMANRFFVFYGFPFPKQLIYASMTTVMCLVFSLFFWSSLTLIAVLALLPGAAASVIFWYETVEIWLRLPSFRK